MRDFKFFHGYVKENDVDMWNDLFRVTTTTNPFTIPTWPNTINPYQPDWTYRPNTILYNNNFHHTIIPTIGGQNFPITGTLSTSGGLTVNNTGITTYTTANHNLNYTNNTTLTSTITSALVDAATDLNNQVRNLRNEVEVLNNGLKNYMVINGNNI